MKKMIVLCLMVIMSLSIYAQTKKAVKVSEKAKAAFEKLYPNAKQVKWSSHYEGTMEASFKQKDKNISVMFKADTVFEERVEMPKDKLPEAVKNHIKEYYKHYSIVHAYEIHSSVFKKDNNVGYWITVKKGNAAVSMVCFQEGRK